LLAVEPASIRTSPASPTLCPGTTVIEPAPPALPLLAPELIDTEPEDEVDDPVDKRAKPLLAEPARVETSTSALPNRDVDPPTDEDDVLVLKPDDITTDPPTPPVPAVTDTEPPSTTPEVLLDPTERAILPAASPEESPVDNRMDPVCPPVAIPEPRTTSPLTVSDSFDINTIDPLDPVELEPLDTIADPPTPS